MRLNERKKSQSRSWETIYRKSGLRKVITWAASPPGRGGAELGSGRREENRGEDLINVAAGKRMAERPFSPDSLDSWAKNKAALAN